MTRTPLACLLLAACGQPPAAHPESSGAGREAIIQGSLESGWPGVGALTFFDNGAYGGSFCTATLFDPQWLLTAAHCITADSGGGAQFDPTPQTTLFFVGADARPAPGGFLPATGNFYAALSFHVHPAYDPDLQTNDVGLVRLAEPALGVTVYPLNNSALTLGDLGSMVTYIGFGATDGISGAGSSRKRSTQLELSEIYSESYRSDNFGPAICFGDSGGPGLLQVGGGTWQVIGVNSTVTTGDCFGFAYHMRVDAYVTWVNNTVAGAPNDCNLDGSLCLCPQACEPDGSCNNAACPTLSCGGLVQCLDPCAGDQSCIADCVAVTSPQALQLYSNVGDCWDSQCGGVPQAQYLACVLDNCLSVTQQCLGDGDEGDTCGIEWECRAGLTCDGASPTCKIQCDPTAPFCPAPGQTCTVSASDFADGLCSPPGGNGCACDVSTNFCDVGCVCDSVCNPDCSCDLAVGCDEDCFCDDACPDSCLCNTTEACVDDCSCDDDCPCACDVDSGCSPACGCDPECYDDGGCACDLSEGCDVDCACDPVCFSCGCDVSLNCDANCPCDEDCAGGCECDASVLCDGNCACDGDCGFECDCDASALCDGGCGCDPDCPNACVCDYGEGCDVGCPCDTLCTARCSCDADPSCDPECACDDDCDACECSISLECDVDCSCDLDCANGPPTAVPAVCGAANPGAWLALGTMLILCRRKRR